MTKVAPDSKANDSDYVFITFILRQLPHGLIGLLIAVFFASTLASKAAELNALGSTTTVDVYRHIVKRDAADAHYVKASKYFTILWGLVAIAFALFAHMVENLIEAVNILGFDFLRSDARHVFGGLFPAPRRWNGDFLGRHCRAAYHFWAVLFASDGHFEDRLSLV